MSQRLEDIARRADQTQQRLSNPGSGSSQQSGSSSSSPQPHQFEQIVRDLYRLQNDVSRIVSQIEQFAFGSQPSYGQQSQPMSQWTSGSAESETRQAVAELASTTSELAREVSKVAVRQ